MNTGPREVLFISENYYRGKVNRRPCFNNIDPFSNISEGLFVLIVEQYYEALGAIEVAARQTAEAIEACGVEYIKLHACSIVHKPFLIHCVNVCRFNILHVEVLIHESPNNACLTYFRVTKQDDFEPVVPIA